ncbi:hypothetical protein BIFGAL_03754 [Bifidobacterium gallicum DSM 20093 = LMG 11596]|uniref:Uncharacterized protein n=1 Tax=Bifidobacterium gallicum DSM 20093 = LMG 11596 TaxID=561180 RepID=D1NV71_9BIFI|nr:hypothetical protein BIFGAL_03754 [Bifidobacterium gallicum DSM 20093 = LMG 11596]
MCGEGGSWNPAGILRRSVMKIILILPHVTQLRYVRQGVFAQIGDGNYFYIL